MLISAIVETECKRRLNTTGDFKKYGRANVKPTKKKKKEETAKGVSRQYLPTS